MGSAVVTAPDPVPLALLATAAALTIIVFLRFIA
jgi:hypothetical protein